ncbi:MAG: hypothetical protein V4787_05290 [Pseudomonadota bacterium]
MPIALPPILDTSSSPAIASVSQGDPNPSGMTVAALVTDHSITVAGSDAPEAIGITALDTSLGAWQYSLDSGAHWLDVRSDLINSETNELALLLGPAAMIRMLPFGDLHGSLAAAITYRAWDGATGPQGSYEVIGASGPGIFSAETETASLHVTQTNHAPTFAPRVAGTGQLVLPVGDAVADSARSVVIQPDGKILVAGFSGALASRDYSVVRLNSDGSLDTAFNGNGKLVLPVGTGSDTVHSIALQPDGKIVLAGVSKETNDRASMVRLNADGTLDSSFNATGKLVAEQPALSGSLAPLVGNAGAIQADGKILLAAMTSEDVGVMRLHADGSVDSGFAAPAGLLSGVMDNQQAGIAFQADGKVIVASGQLEDSNGAPSGITLARLMPDGTLDLDFHNGAVTLSSYHGTDVALQSDGKIVVAGYASAGQTPDDFYILRLTSAGELDPGFNSGAPLTMPMSTARDRAHAVIIQSDGKILVTGESGSSFVAIRLNEDGTSDTSFGIAGRVVLDISGSAVGGYTAALQPDGKIVIASDSNADFFVARLNADGSLDTTFASTAGANTLGGTFAYVENAAAVALAASVAVQDEDQSAAGNYGGTAITLARAGGASAQDVFSATGNLGLSGGDVVLSGSSIGAYVQSGGTLTITFSSAATQAKVNEALSSLAYANSSDAPPASVTIGWTFNDGSGAANATATGSTVVNITSINDAPTAHDSTIALLGTETRTLGTAAFGFVDADGNNFASVMLTSLPAAGALQVNGVTLLAPGEIPASDFATLKYIPAGNADSSSTFDFKVIDDGGLANGGSNTSAQHTITLDVSEEIPPPPPPPPPPAPSTGTSGSDVMTGLATGDILSAGAGDDVLFGLAGDDSLDGGKGHDTLVGGAGSDMLVGGRNHDAFVFDNTSGVDTILDFRHDKLVFDQSGLGAIGDGDTRVEGANNRASTGAFSPDAEVLIFKSKAPVADNAAAASALIGSAKSAYEAADQVVIAINDPTHAAIYLFHSSGNDALVSPTELTLIGLVPSGQLHGSDFKFQA